MEMLQPVSIFLMSVVSSTDLMRDNQFFNICRVEVLCARCVAHILSHPANDVRNTRVKKKEDIFSSRWGRPPPPLVAPHYVQHPPWARGCVMDGRVDGTGPFRMYAR